MKVQQKIEAILKKYNLSFEDEVPTEEVTNAVKLEDGTEVQSDGELAEGASVFVVNEEDEKIPLPDGVYKTDAGVEFEVEDGKVSSMEAAEEVDEEEGMEDSAEMGHGEDKEDMEEEEDEDEEEEQMTKEEDEEEMEDEEEEKEMYSKQQMLSAVAEIATTLKKDHKETVGELKAKIKKLEAQLAEQPAGEGIGRVPQMTNPKPAVKGYQAESFKSANQIFEQYS